MKSPYVERGLIEVEPSAEVRVRLILLHHNLYCTPVRFDPAYGNGKGGYVPAAEVPILGDGCICRGEPLKLVQCSKENK